MQLLARAPEDVVFLYRPTREGDFLKSLLKGFKGVLVSDCYAAYAALDCPQQKCLIHLLRDMNQDLTPRTPSHFACFPSRARENDGVRPADAAAPRSTCARSM